MADLMYNYLIGRQPSIGVGKSIDGKSFAFPFFKPIVQTGICVSIDHNYGNFKVLFYIFGPAISSNDYPLFGIPSRY
jgi:hypothetical protein